MESIIRPQICVYWNDSHDLVMQMQVFTAIHCVNMFKVFFPRWNRFTVSSCSSCAYFNLRQNCTTLKRDKNLSVKQDDNNLFYSSGWTQSHHTCFVSQYHIVFVLPSIQVFFFLPFYWIWIVPLCFIWGRFNIPVTLLNLTLNVDVAIKPAGIKHLRMTQLLSLTPSAWGLTYTQTQTRDYEEILQEMPSFPNNKGRRKCVTQR